MSNPSDKHMEAAEALRGIQCGASDPCFDGPCHCRDSIASALAKVEQECMRRAAEIARLYGEAAWSLPGELEVAAGICSRILSQANSHSPDTLPVEADQATGAKSSSAPVATYDPWTVKNGRRA